MSRFGRFIFLYFKLLTTIMAIMFVVEHGYFLDGNIIFSNTEAFRFTTMLYVPLVIIEIVFMRRGNMIKEILEVKE